MNISLDIENNASVLSLIDDSKIASNKMLSSYDFVLYLDKDPYSALELEKLNLRLFNRAEPIRLCDDKMLTYIELANHGIKLPKIIFSPLNYSKHISLDFIENLEKNLDFPMIVKKCYGSQGIGVDLINSDEELIKYEEKNFSLPHLFQEYIQSSKGRDIRIIVIGGKAIAVMERVAPEGDFRSNIANGGIGKKVDVSQSFIDTAIQCSKILGLDYCGVDLLIGKDGEPIVCEVNSNAFIEGIEKATSVNVAKAYAEYIYNDIYKE